jgi:uncharacterized protein (TIGR00369 family)
MSDTGGAPGGAVERRYVFDPCLMDWSGLHHLSGLEIMQRLLSGELPMAPMAATLDIRLTEVARGRVVFEGRPAQHAYNLQRTVHGGWAATLLDSAMGCAVISTMPPGRSHTTTELSIRYVRALTVATGPVRAEATVLHVGRRLATAEGRMIGVADGKLYAHGQTSCMVLEV